MERHRGQLTEKVGTGTPVKGGTGRPIPISDDLYAVLTRHAQWFTARFGETKPEYYLFPWGKTLPTDPTGPITTLKKAWDNVRKAAGVRCRFHDLRHTALTNMAEAGVPESTMMALAGHMSRAMLERYSHVRMEAKRKAVEAISLSKKERHANRVPTKVPTVVADEKVN